MSTTPVEDRLVQRRTVEDVSDIGEGVKVVTSAVILPSTEEHTPGGLASHPLWSEFLAEIAANRQADSERDARDYAE